MWPAHVLSAIPWGEPMSTINPPEYQQSPPSAAAQGLAETPQGPHRARFRFRSRACA
jgi:hypothetical protein